MKRLLCLLLGHRYGQARYCCARPCADVSARCVRCGDEVGGVCWACKLDLKQRKPAKRVEVRT